ncbi:hypothetical protein SRHO_G00145500 [Serrasalmus rhombeus]
MGVTTNVQDNDCSVHSLQTSCFPPIHPYPNSCSVVMHTQTEGFEAVLALTHINADKGPPSPLSSSSSPPSPG